MKYGSKMVKTFLYNSSVTHLTIDHLIALNEINQLPHLTAEKPCLVTALAISFAALAPRDWIRLVASTRIPSRLLSMSPS